MKKKHLNVTKGLITLFSCLILFLFSCKPKSSPDDCSQNEITQQDAAILAAYNVGTTAVFKNDNTGVYDTLHVTNKGYQQTLYNEPCNKAVNTPLYTRFTFTHLYNSGVYVYHNSATEIGFSSPTPSSSKVFKLNGSSQSFVINGTSYNDVIITSGKREEVPLLAKAGDFSLSFIKPSYSKKSSSPTKMGELLAMGIPVVCNDGVGDVKQIIERTKGGVVIADFSEKSFKNIISNLAAILALSPQDIRNRAFEYYDLNKAREKYVQVYKTLLKD